jgi:hypothetical protein
MRCRELFRRNQIANKFKWLYHLATHNYQAHCPPSTVQRDALHTAVMGSRSLSKRPGHLKVQLYCKLISSGWTRELWEGSWHSLLMCIFSARLSNWEPKADYARVSRRWSGVCVQKPGTADARTYYCPQITSWSLLGVNVLSAVRGEYRACRWMEDFLLVSDKET